MQKSDLFMGFSFLMGFREISMPETGPILHNPIYIFQTKQNVSKQSNLCIDWHVFPLVI